MLERRATINNSRGLHARAAAKFVELSQSFEATITVIDADREADGKSMMSIMLLAAGKGRKLTLRASGADEHAALTAICALIADGFGELD